MAESTCFATVSLPAKVERPGSGWTGKPLGAGRFTGQEIFDQAVKRGTGPSGSASQGSGSLRANGPAPGDLRIARGQNRAAFGWQPVQGSDVLRGGRSCVRKAFGPIGARAGASSDGNQFRNRTILGWVGFGSQSPSGRRGPRRRQGVSLAGTMRRPRLSTWRLLLFREAGFLQARQFGQIPPNKKRDPAMVRRIPSSASADASPRLCTCVILLLPRT